MSWQFGGVVFEATQVQSDYQGHQITTRVRESDRNQLRLYSEQAGKIDVLTLSDGDFESYDRSDTGISERLIPPSDTPYTTATYRVNGYDESPLGQGLAGYEITLDLVRENSRETTNTVTQTRGTDEWLFEFQNDTVSVSNADVAIDQTGQDSEVQINIDGQDTITRVVLENPAYQDGVQEWSVPNGDDFAEDVTTNDRQTVTVTPPDLHQVREILPPDQYIVTNWTITNNQPPRYQISMSVKPPKTTVQLIGVAQYGNDLYGGTSYGGS